MNKEFIDSFIKRAEAAGLSKAQAEAFIAKEIQTMNKKAGDDLDNLISDLLKSASLEKTAETVAYTEGVLKAAVEKGCNVNQAAEIAKIALNRIAPSIRATTPVQLDPKIANYAEGFLKAASNAGLNYNQAVGVLKQALDSQGADPGMIQALLAQLMGGQGGGDPSAAMGGGAGDGGQLPPSILQALMGGGAGGGGMSGGMGGGMQPPPTGGMGGGAGQLFKQLPSTGAA